MKKTLSTVTVGDTIYTTEADWGGLSGPYAIVEADETTFEIVNGGIPQKFFRDTGKYVNYGLFMATAIIPTDEAVAAHERGEALKKTRERIQSKLDRLAFSTVSIVRDADLGAFEGAMDAAFVAMFPDGSPYTSKPRRSK